MRIVIIGNGILGLATALELVRKDSRVEVTIVGPFGHPGCASLAAAAMFNSFCELDRGTLSNKIEREKFLFNKMATSYWPNYLKQLEQSSQTPLEYGFGTYLINNPMSDTLEDENFEAVVAGLQEFKEPYETINPRHIPNYHPLPSARATRAILINGEGWVNPIQLIQSIKATLEKCERVTFTNGLCKKLKKNAGRIEHIVLDNGEIVSGDTFLLSPGANFSQIVAASDLGLNFPRIFYGVGCSILLNTGDSTLKNCIRTPNRGLACGIYSAPQSATSTLIGASNFISPVPQNFGRATSVYVLLKAAMEQINAAYYRADVVKVNVGWRPTSADTLPLIGKTSIKNLVVATGTKRDGLHCAPLISNYLSEIILNGKSTFSFPLFTPERDLVRLFTREEAIEASIENKINAAYQHEFRPSTIKMVDDLRAHFRQDLVALHDKVGAYDWGIPPEMTDMYRYEHILGMPEETRKLAKK